MRKRYAPLGWPHRDPRRHRFAMPNKVWDYQLKPVEFVIFSYLCYGSAHGQADKLTPEVVAEAVHLTVTSVKKYLTGLLGKRLVADGWSLTSALQITNSEKFFTLPNEVFLLKLPPSAFVVYAYLLLIEDRRTHTCHPSYNTIAAATGTSKNTAIKSISVLLEVGLITAESSSYFDKHGMKWKGNNLYTILSVRPAVDAFHQRQLCQLELDVERRRVRRRQEEYDRHHPRTALCASAVDQAALDPSQLPDPLCARRAAQNGAPAATQRSGCGGERRSGEMNELCRLRRSEGYEARDDEEQEKAPALLLRRCGHNRPQCGQFTGVFRGSKVASV